MLRVTVGLTVDTEAVVVGVNVAETESVLVVDAVPDCVPVEVPVPVCVPVPVWDSVPDTV